jgi:hypothetical protein
MGGGAPGTPAVVDGGFVNPGYDTSYGTVTETAGPWHQARD